MPKSMYSRMIYKENTRNTNSKRSIRRTERLGSKKRNLKSKVAVHKPHKKHTPNLSNNKHQTRRSPGKSRGRPRSNRNITRKNRKNHKNHINHVNHINRMHATELSGGTWTDMLYAIPKGVIHSAKRLKNWLTSSSQPKVQELSFVVNHEILRYSHRKLKEFVRKNNEDSFASLARLALKVDCRTIDSGYKTDYLLDVATDVFACFKKQPASTPQQFGESDVVAFIFAERQMEGNFEIGLICASEDAPGAGRFLLHHVLEYADNNAWTVTLSAITYVLGYYYKPEFGFKFIKSCGETEDIKNIDTLKNRINDDQSNYKDLLEELHQKGFNAADAADACSKDMTFKELRENGCFLDGFKMMRCGK